MENPNKYIGKGLIFPIVLDNGSPRVATGTELVRRSILTILNWNMRRYYLYEFYCRLHELLEEPNDGLLRDLIRFFVIEMIQKFETRVILMDSRVVSISDTKIEVEISYQMISTQITDSFIWPFYKSSIAY